MWTKVPVRQIFTDNRTNAAYAANIAKSYGTAAMQNTSKSAINSKDTMNTRTIDNTVDAYATKTDSTGYADSKTVPEYSFDIEVTQKNLTEAIIWSEILGKPMCKRRERR